MNYSYDPNIDLKGFTTLFADLDGTLIETHTGDTFPNDPMDFHIRPEVLYKIKEMRLHGNLHNVCIVTNQGGIPDFISEQDFITKISTISSFIEKFTGLKTSYFYCASQYKECPRRKPNIGMFNEAMIASKKLSPKGILMIGDASGKPDDFSDSDFKAACKFKCAYMDINDFINHEIMKVIETPG